MLDEKFQRNASELAIFYLCGNIPAHNGRITIAMGAAKFSGLNLGNILLILSLMVHNKRPILLMSCGKLKYGEIPCKLQISKGFEQ